MFPRARPTLSLLSTALTLAVVAPACSDPVAITIQPEIQVVAEDDKDLAGLHFGRVPTELGLEMSILVKSLRPVQLDVSAIEVEARDGISAQAFSVETEVPFSVAGSSSQKVAIRFAPAEERSYNATLVVHSSDPAHPQTRISMTGEGTVGSVVVTACLPNAANDPGRCSRTLVEAPTPLEVGSLIAGQVQAVDVTVGNLGFDELRVGAVRFADEEAATAAGWVLEEKVRQGVTVQPRGNQTFSIRLSPDVGTSGDASVTLVIESSDKSQPTVELPLEAAVIGNQPPLACLTVAEVRSPSAGTVFEEGEPVVVGPTDEIVFESAVREGCTGDPEGGSVTTSWTLEGPDAFARLEDEFGRPTQRVFRAQLIGDFAVELEATDELGLSSSTDENGVPARVAFTVRPTQDIAVEVSWPGREDVDLDLHLVRGDQSQLFSNTNDCHGQNPNPTWGRPEDQPRSNPSLAWDDQGTKGLFETGLLNLPEANQIYSLYVHVFQDSRMSRNTAPDCLSTAECGAGLVCSLGKCMERVPLSARVFIKGEEVHQADYELNEPCETWEIGTITWPATEGATPLMQPTSLRFTTGTPVGTQCAQL